MNNHVADFQDNRVFVFHDEMFQQPVTAQHCKMQIYPLVSKTDFLKTMSFFSGCTGVYCETKIDPCQGISCGSNSYCALGLCLCTGTFTGPACDKSKLVYSNQFRLSHCALVTPIWWHRPGSTLAQVMVCHMAAPSHNLKQCCLFISKVQRDWSESNLTRDTTVIYY